MFHQRLSSAYLPDQDYSDYLVEQYLDIQDVCTVSSMPELTTRGPFYYATATTSANVASGTAPASSTTTGSSPSATCLGQVVDTGLNVTSANATIACNQLSLAYGVTTGDLQAISGGDDCYSPDLFGSVASDISNSITSIQFLTWNPNIIGLCDLLQEGQYICQDAPGGSYIPPPNPTGDSNAGGQERGGPGGVDPTGITGTQTILVTSTPLGQAPTAAPEPTQPGIAPDCNSYAKAVSGDYCQEFAQNNSIAPNELYAWNTVLGPGGSNCTTQFFANYYYCVGVATSGNGGTPSPTTTSSPSSTTPSPTQSGIPPYCNKYFQPTSGDSCTTFAQANNIPATDLYTWKPVLGPGGANCTTQLFLGYNYCEGIAPPTPTQTGIAGDCNAYAQAADGDYCVEFAQEQGITAEELYAWNAVLGEAVGAIRSFLRGIGIVLG
ncbi:MAG: hypothetical protein Q9195_007198 [Heterodermia aff. obscurata]